MIEYETKEKNKAAEAEQKQFEDSVTESTKDAVKKIAKRMGDKKAIDSDDEAQALLTMLRNTKGDLNKADLEYIRRALIDSGYGSLLEEGSSSAVTAEEMPENATATGSETPPVPSTEEVVVEDKPTAPADKPSGPTKPTPRPVKPKPTPEPDKPAKPEVPKDSPRKTH